MVTKDAGIKLLVFLVVFYVFLPIIIIIAAYSCFLKMAESNCLNFLSFLTPFTNYFYYYFSNIQVLESESQTKLLLLLHSMLLHTGFLAVIFWFTTGMHQVSPLIWNTSSYIKLAIKSSTKNMYAIKNKLSPRHVQEWTHIFYYLFNFLVLHWMMSLLINNYNLYIWFFSQSWKNLWHC